ncbi:MAG: hypothetical protein V2I37_06825 [Marinilabiliaceae bacterium]|nr:hypothetical protein [Marinilabiliaceae bacterium]
MKSTLIFFSAALLLLSCNRPETVRYRIDINSLQDDKLKIEYYCPEPGVDTICFQFVRMDPGHTRSYTNFGLYTSDLRAYDSKNKSLPVVKTDTNIYQILNAGKLCKITYLADDTWDDTLHTSNRFASCAGTSFEPEVNYLLNGGIYGYAAGYENKPVSLEILAPEGLSVYGYDAAQAYGGSNIYKLSDFRHLYDTPMMVCKADTASFKISGIEFRISVFNEQNKLLAREFAKKMLPGLDAALLFFNNNLPLESYDFLFYIKDFSELDRFIRKADNFDSETVDKVIEIYEQYNNYEQSALEHRSSSLFCMQADYDEQGEFMMLDYVIHEFIHVITPKAISSRLIKEFDFADPELSKHRWLYEGVTEYFSGLIKLRADLISPEFYLQGILSEKLAVSATYPPGMPFTEFSKYANIYPYKAHYHQSYYHGPVLALMLDLEIIKLTCGEKDLKEVIMDLLRQEKVLTEENLIPEFVRLADPRLQDFFDRYISGTEELPLEEAFNSVGINYYEELPGKVPDISFSAIPLFNYYLISRSNIDAIRAGDKLDINIIGRDGRKIFKDTMGNFIPAGENISVSLIRDTSEADISFPAKYREGKLRYQLIINPEASGQQLVNRAKWTGKNIESD